MGTYVLIFLGCIYLWVELLGSNVFGILTNHHLSSKASVPFYSSTSSVWGFQFLPITVNTYLLHFNFSYPNENGVTFHCGFNLHVPKWLIILSILSSHWPFAYLLWRNTYSNLLAIFKLGYLSFYCWVKLLTYWFSILGLSAGVRIKWQSAL